MNGIYVSLCDLWMLSTVDRIHWVSVNIFIPYTIVFNRIQMVGQKAWKGKIMLFSFFIKKPYRISTSGFLSAGMIISLFFCLSIKFCFSAKTLHINWKQLLFWVSLTCNKTLKVFHVNYFLRLLWSFQDFIAVSLTLHFETGQFVFQAYHLLNCKT